MRVVRGGSGFVILLALGCAPTDPGVPFAPLDAPELHHVPPEGPHPAGVPLTLELWASDPEGLREVAVHHRSGPGAYRKVILEPLGEERFAFTVQDPRPPLLEYWFRAYDASDGAVPGVLPAQGADAPFRVEVEVAGRGAPWAEDFDSATGALDLYALGLSEAALQATGQEWGLSEQHSHSPPWSVRHRKGPEAAFADDWLISPVLDLRELPEVELTWYELGIETHRATHSLWLSTGSPDPEDGDFTLVTELGPPPEQAWGRSDLVDLSAWGGSPRVTLAWRYEGSHADTWYLDDLSLRALGPDLHLVSLTHGLLEPGAVGDLELSLENHGAPPGESVSLTVVAAGEVAFDGPIEALHEVRIPLAVDADTPSPSLLPLSLVAAADGRTWTFDAQAVVGEPAVAQVALEARGPAFVRVTVGSGGGEVEALAAVLPPGSHTLQEELYDLAAHLPPGPGPDRWFAEVETDGQVTVTGFTIAHGGELYAGDDLGVVTGGERTFWLPTPPRPVLAWHVHPELAPGATSGLRIQVSDVDGPTVGQLTLALQADPRLTLGDPGPIALPGPLAPDPVRVHQTAVTVDPSAQDNRPLPVTLTLSDDWDQWTETAWLPVPWPVLRSTGAEVGGDLHLDPGEPRDLQLTATNIGDRSLPRVDCHLDRSRSTASLPELAPGASTVLTFPVTLGPRHRPGQALPTTLTCGQWATTTTLFVSEPQSTWLLPAEDAPDDALDGYGFDILYGRWRVLDETLELEVFASTPFDPTDVLLDVWARSPGAPYTWYQLTALDGVGILRGYQAGAWKTLEAPEVVAVGDRTLRIRLSIPALELAQPSLSLGVGAGFCGGAAYYCDHYPDGWGGPYGVGLHTSALVSLSW